jgi:hypothetical protein
MTGNKMTWDEVCSIMEQCKHPGQVGWRISRILRIPPYRVWERALDVKYGLQMVKILKQAVKARKRPQWVCFDRKGNVEAHW